jgi:hypothetical protein
MISLGHCCVPADICSTVYDFILFIFTHRQTSSLTNSILDLGMSMRDDSLHFYFLNFFHLYPLIHLFSLFLFSLITNQRLGLNYFSHVMERIHSPMSIVWFWRKTNKIKSNCF